MEYLRTQRKKKGLTQKQLAEMCGISESAINRIESGKRQPSFDVLQKLSKALDCSVDHLLTGKSGLIASVRPFELGDDETETIDEFGNTAEPVKRSEEDAELAALLEDMRTRPGMRMLFKLAHDATEDDVKQAVKIIEALRKE